MIQKLAKQFVSLLYLSVIKNGFIHLTIGILAFIITQNAVIALCIGLVYALHVTCHEWGHVLFLEKARIAYKYAAKRISIEIIFNEEEFNQLFKKSKILIITGGSMISAIFDVMIFLLPTQAILHYFVVLLILVEGANLILGKDSRVLEKTLKEKSV